MSHLESAAKCANSLGTREQLEQESNECIDSELQLIATGPRRGGRKQSARPPSRPERTRNEKLKPGHTEQLHCLLTCVTGMTLQSNPAARRPALLAHKLESAARSSRRMDDTARNSSLLGMAVAAVTVTGTSSPREPADSLNSVPAALTADPPLSTVAAAEATAAAAAALLSTDASASPLPLYAASGGAAVPVGDAAAAGYSVEAPSVLLPKATLTELALSIPSAITCIAEFLDPATVARLRAACSCMRLPCEDDRLWMATCAAFNYKRAPLKPADMQRASWLNIFRKKVLPRREIPLGGRVSVYNQSYYCVVEAIAFIAGEVGVRIHERGDMSMGELQVPNGSKLRGSANVNVSSIATTTR